MEDKIENDELPTRKEVKESVTLEMKKIIIDQLKKCQEEKKIPSRELLDTIDTFMNVFKCF